MQVIRSSGHEMTFLMHGRNNWRRPESDIWYRVLASDQSRMAFWRDLQIMPVLREMRALFGATH
jgi:hypothetical protein